MRSAAHGKPIEDATGYVTERLRSSEEMRILSARNRSYVRLKLFTHWNIDNPRVHELQVVPLATPYCQSFQSPSLQSLPLLPVLDSSPSCQYYI